MLVYGIAVALVLVPTPLVECVVMRGIEVCMHG